MPSIFPTGIDTFTTHYDPPSSMLNSIARFEQLRSKQNKTSTELEEYRNLTTTLAPYIFTTEELNTMQDAMVKIESFFITDVQDFVETSISELHTSVEDYADGIETAGTTQLQSINTTAEGHLSSINSAYQTNLSSINTTAEGYLDDIEAAGTEQLESINTTAEGHLSDINNTAATHKSQIESTTTEYLTDLDDKADQYIETMRQNAEEYEGAFTYIGEYDEATTYYEHNIVSKNNNLYKLTVESATGVDPLNEASWDLMMKSTKGDKGDKGDPGSNLIFMGVWEAEHEYAQNSLTSYGNKLYACIEAHTSTSTFDSTKWDCVTSSDNIDMAALAYKLGYLYRYDLGADGKSMTEKIVPSFSSSSPLDDESYGEPVLTCQTTLTDAGDKYVVTSVYTDPLHFFGSSDTFTITSNFNTTSYVFYGA